MNSFITKEQREQLRVASNEIRFVKDNTRITPEESWKKLRNIRNTLSVIEKDIKKKT